MVCILFLSDLYWNGEIVFFFTVVALGGKWKRLACDKLYFLKILETTKRVRVQVREQEPKSKWVWFLGHLI